MADAYDCEAADRLQGVIVLCGVVFVLHRPGQRAKNLWSEVPAGGRPDHMEESGLEPEGWPLTVMTTT
ncbi:hypothetical protein EYF80_035707 [Liparis tanakae]|uniref:Uncharacterized protein n=1 Tax=Liparis tanakae TaxID=230148 RepID=A0A4Z2GKT4_9TELE|nr:hypothetical protein EYF80_035707 [Liparis tanakae]